jgi:formylmethanofuran dehydrogenase subunit E
MITYEERCQMKINILIIILAFLFVCPSVQSKEKIEPSEEFLQRAVEFHGHLGPYLVLGLRAGIYANQALCREPMKTEAFIQTKTTPPESCFADGVQLSTGCTFGKGNISLQEGEGLLVTFKKNSKKLTLKLRKEIIEEMNSLPSEEKAWEDLAKDLYHRKIEKIFEITKKKH